MASDDRLLQGFGVCYVLVASLFAFQITRTLLAVTRSPRGRRAPRLLITIHVLGLGTALARATLGFLLAHQSAQEAEDRAAGKDVDETMDAALDLLYLLPVCFETIAFTFLIFAWAGLYHFSLASPHDPFQRLRLPFIITNVVVCTAFSVRFFIALANKSDDTYHAVSQAVTLVQGVVVLILIGGLATYGHLLTKILRRNNTVASGVTRFLYGAMVFSICLLMITFVYLMQVFSNDTVQEHQDTYATIFFGADLVALLVMLQLFRPGVRKLTKDAKQAQRDHAGRPALRSDTMKAGRSGARAAVQEAARAAGVDTPSASLKAPLLAQHV